MGLGDRVSQIDQNFLPMTKKWKATYRILLAFLRHKELLEVRAGAIEYGRFKSPTTGQMKVCYDKEDLQKLGYAKALWRAWFGKKAEPTQPTRKSRYIEI